MDLRASACRGAARIKAVRAPRVADSGATPRRPVRRAGGRGERGPDRHREGGDRTALVLAAGARSGRRSRGSRPCALPSSRGARLRTVPAHPLQERQLTQAPGARADVTLRHVCGRPGALGLAEPPGGPPSSARPGCLRRGRFLLDDSTGRSPRSVAFWAVAEAGGPGRERGRESFDLSQGSHADTRPVSG